MMKMNWITIIGVIIIAIGTYITYYGLFISGQEDKKEIINKIEEQGSKKGINIETIKGDFVQGNKIEINQISSHSYQNISDELKNKVQQNLTNFKKEFSEIPRIIIEIESGNSLRDKVAKDLEKFLLTFELGGYPKGNTFIGRFPDYPISVFYNSDNKLIAENFIVAISPYITEGFHRNHDTRFSKDIIKIYLNGTPIFSPNGAVRFE